MYIIENMNLGLRFLIELCGLVALGYWGFHSGNGIIMKILLGMGSPLFIAMIWGIFGSPNSIVKLSKPLHLLLEIIIFVLPVIALFFSGKSNLAWIYGVIVIFNRLLMLIWKQ